MWNRSRRPGYDFPAPCAFTPEDPLLLVDRFAQLGIAGGAVYDGLVGLAAHHDRRVLRTRDERAERTYRRLKITYELVAEPAA